MTKPNDFILNSDYLALAQTNNATEFTAIFAAETFPAGYAYDRTQDFKAPSSPGAIDMYLTSLNGGEYNLGNYIVISSGSPTLSIYISRVTSNVIRVRLHEFTNQTGGYSMPMQTLKIKVTSFEPPDVF